jgi:predicted enzyme related to lactoylglutathione lyase
MSAAPITRIVLYVRDMQKVALFYARHFDFRATISAAKDKIVLISPVGGCSLVVLQASKGHKTGQSCIKIVFDVADVSATIAEQLKLGLKFGPIWRGDGYEFSNARDPARNLIQISTGHLKS